MLNVNVTDPYRQFEHRSWERAAALYASSFERVTALFNPALVDALAIQPGMHVLDVACGSGLLSSQAADRGAKVCGLDFSAEMIAQARHRFPHVRFSHGDAEAMAFPDESFDAVMVGFGVHHFPHPARALGEVRRVLKPGGRVAFTVWAAQQHLLQSALVRAVADIAGRPSALPGPPQGDINTIEACRAVMRAAGFQDTDVREVTQAVTLSSIGQYVQMMIDGTARASAMLQALSGEQRGQLESLLGERLQAHWLDAEGVFVVPAVALLATSRK